MPQWWYVGQPCFERLRLQNYDFEITGEVHPISKISWGLKFG
jgi:hypothetical protein